MYRNTPNPCKLINITLLNAKVWIMNKIWICLTSQCMASSLYRTATLTSLKLCYCHHSTLTKNQVPPNNLVPDQFTCITDNYWSAPAKFGPDVFSWNVFSWNVVGRRWARKAILTCLRQQWLISERRCSQATVVVTRRELLGTKLGSYFSSMEKFLWRNRETRSVLEYIVTKVHSIIRHFP